MPEEVVQGHGSQMLNLWVPQRERKPPGTDADHGGRMVKWSARSLFLACGPCRLEATVVLALMLQVRVE